MLTPMLQALPIAIPIALAAIALGGYAAQRYVDHMPFLPVRARRQPSTARHRMTPAAALPVAVEAPAAPKAKAPKIKYDPLDHRIPLAEVERRMRVDALAARIEEVREVAPMWSWSDEVTHELVAAP